MIMRVEVEADTLQEWHDKLFELREANLHKRHKNPLLLSTYHNLIQNLVTECSSFTEFGMCQGHSLSAALLAKPKKVRGYDITFDWYNHSHHLFEQFAKENEVDFKVFEADTSTCPVIEETDILHIDSLHTYEHCKKELNRHGHMVKKYILFHDTTYTPSVFNAITEFIKNGEWELAERCTTGVGYTLIKHV